jgi:hypothetical protein
VLGEHGIYVLDTQSQVEIRLPPTPATTTARLILDAVDSDEAKSRAETALAEAEAGCIECQVR